jgi:hypothetical protein
VPLAVVSPGKPSIAKDIENCANDTYLVYSVAVTVVAVINDRTAVVWRIRLMRTLPSKNALVDTQDRQEMNI